MDGPFNKYLPTDAWVWLWGDKGLQTTGRVALGGSARSGKAGHFREGAPGMRMPRTREDTDRKQGNNDHVTFSQKVQLRGDLYICFFL